MTWQEKLIKIKALCPFTGIGMRSANDFYVMGDNIEIADGRSLRSPTESGRTPAEAVNLHWKHLTRLKRGERLVVNSKREQPIVWDEQSKTWVQY